MAQALRQSIDFDQLFQQRLEVLERNHVRAIRRCAVWIWMRLDENAGDADGHSRAGEHRHETPFTPARRALHSPLPHPLAVPCPPGCCTEWVASKMTGAPVSARMGSARMSETSVL